MPTSKKSQLTTVVACSSAVNYLPFPPAIQKRLGAADGSSISFGSGV